MVCPFFGLTLNTILLHRGYTDTAQIYQMVSVVVPDMVQTIHYYRHETLTKVFVTQEKQILWSYLLQKMNKTKILSCIFRGTKSFTKNKVPK